MKATNSIFLALLSLFTAVFSSPLLYNQDGSTNSVFQSLSSFSKRDLGPIWTTLDAITAELAKMNKTLEAFNGDPITAVPVLDAAAATLKVLETGWGTINATEELNLITAALVLVPVGFLYKAVDGVTAQLSQKKALFEKADVGFVVKDELEKFKKVAGDVITVTLKKIPWWLGIISQPIGGSIKGLLDKAAKDYGVPDTPAA